MVGIKFGDFSQNAFFEVWQISNFAIQYMCIYLWMAGLNIGSLYFGVFFADCQIAKLKTPPNFCAIRYSISTFILLSSLHG